MLPQVSFLIPAHNEEKIIHRALDNLEEILCPEIEVLVGLDGCTDGTKEVVSRYAFAHQVELDERGGKPAVLRRLSEIARGEIIVVHDADLRFICDHKGLQSLIHCFLDDPQIGGVILPPYSIPFLEYKEEIESRHLLGSSLGAYLLWRFLFDRQVVRKGDALFADSNQLCYPFTVNIYRRGIIPDTETAADDFERFFLLVERGYRVRIFNDRQLPYFRLTYHEIDFANHVKQRTRGHLSRKQIVDAFGFEFGLTTFTLPFLFYCLQSYRHIGWRDWSTLWLWWAAILLGWFRSRGLAWAHSARKLDTKGIWGFRLRGSS